MSLREIPRRTFYKSKHFEEYHYFSEVFRDFVDKEECSVKS